jgi:hypothetical protein
VPTAARDVGWLKNGWTLTVTGSARVGHPYRAHRVAHAADAIFPDAVARLLTGSCAGFTNATGGLDGCSQAGQVGPNMTGEFVMLFLSMLMLAAPALAPTIQVSDNPFTQTAKPTRTRSRSTAAKRTPAGSAPRASGSTYYANCAAARAAGAAPVMRGQPGYSRKLDRDNDGVGCE